jgi:hypothetical protein
MPIYRRVGWLSGLPRIKRKHQICAWLGGSAVAFASAVVAPAAAFVASALLLLLGLPHWPVDWKWRRWLFFIVSLRLVALMLSFFFPLQCSDFYVASYRLYLISTKENTHTQTNKNKQTQTTKPTNKQHENTQSHTPRS